MCTAVSQLCSYKRKMFYLYIYHWLFPVFLSLFPCYEAIHHKILDSEEIILYIEVQRCHLTGKAQFNHLPVFAPNKGQCYFYSSIAAEEEWGGRKSLRDSPALRWYTPQGHPEGTLPKLHWSDSNCFTERGFIWSTRWLHIISSFFLCELKLVGGGLAELRSFIFHVCPLSRAASVRCNGDDSLFFSLLTHFLLGPIVPQRMMMNRSQHMLGPESICHVTNNVSRIFS